MVVFQLSERTFDYELKMISYTSGYDEIGNYVNDVPVETIVYCDKESVRRAEFYGAASTSHNPEIVFVVHTFEYEGQKAFVFDEENYKLVRSYSENEEEIELICEKVT